MIEIIPNWHPIFVHFTVALFTAAFGFALLSFCFSHLNILSPSLCSEFEAVSRWCLWSAAFATLFTVAAGLYAFNTVQHDEAGHIAMISHRSWALSTAITMWIVACWSGWRYYKHKNLTISFLITLLTVQLLLLSTAWHGAELVYRHGLGVISLPQIEKEEHHHHEMM